MKSLCWIIVMILQMVHTVDMSVVKRQCRFEARMIALNATLSGQRQTDLQRYIETRRQQFRHQLHSTQVRPRFKRQFLMPMPRPRQTGTSDDPDSIENRSLCPWYRVLDSNSTRIPRNMYKAECVHDNGNNECNFSFSRLMGDDQARKYMEYFSIETECAVVYDKKTYEIECCDNGIYRTEKIWADWPVACACARKKVRTAPSVN